MTRSIHGQARTPERTARDAGSHRARLHLISSHASGHDAQRRQRFRGLHRQPRERSQAAQRFLH
eukprot:3260069-Rhodomonas_salina.2